MAVTREEIDKALFQVRAIGSALAAETNAAELNRLVTQLLGIACGAQRDYSYLIEQAARQTD